MVIYIYIYRSYITFVSIKTSFFLSLSRLSLYPRRQLFIHLSTLFNILVPGFSSYSICFCTAIEWTNVRIDRGKTETFHSVDPRKYIYIYISSTCLEARGSFSKFFPTSGSICISSSGNSIHCQEIVDDS